MNPSVDEYEFNTLRTVGGSVRLTLLKDAAVAAEIDVAPPRPTLVHLPAAPGVWLGCILAQYPSQRERVRLRGVVTDTLATDMTIVGEYPVDLRGKVGSTVTSVPPALVERLGLEVGEGITTLPIAPGLVLFVSEPAIDRFGCSIGAAGESLERAMIG